MAFPPTRRTLVEAASSADQVERRDAWEALVAGYWRPVYQHLRGRHGRGPEDARDLTQGFFARAMEKDFFRAFDPSRARFRTFLRVCLDGFVANEDKARRALKRGGARLPLPADFEALEGELAAPAKGGDPDAAFHAEWVRSVLGDAVAELRRACAERGWQARFAVFERYDLAGTGERPTYEVLAQEAGVPATTVTNWLFALRRELGERVLRRLRRLAASDEEYRRDARELLGIDPP